MLNYEDKSAIAEIRNYLEDTGFRYVSQRITDSGIPLVFADFTILQTSYKGLNPIYRFLFSVFRQGHPTDEAIARQAFPPNVFDAMVATGLLVQNERKQWRTPGLVIIPLEGLHLFVSTPPTYPTAISKRQPVYLGIDSTWLLSALPAKMHGRRVVDICSGSGVQGMVCALRGSSKVVCLEKNEETVSVSRFNVELNCLSDIVEVRQSDICSSLGSDEKFDFFVTNPPFIPISDEIDFPLPGAGGMDGMRLTRRILSELPAHLSEKGEGYMICVALGDQYTINFNREVLEEFAEERGFEIQAWVHDKIPIDDYMNDWMQRAVSAACPDLSAEERNNKIAAWYSAVRAEGIPAEYTYTEVIRFRARAETKGIFNISIYNPLLTDPLVAKTAPRGA